MKMKKILVVTCSKDDGKKSPLLQSLKQLKDDISVVINANNKTGLSECYNRQLVPENLIKHDIILFAHDDVYIDDLKLKGKLYTATQNMDYDIIGIAGATKMKIKKPYLWHLMADRSDFSGAVTHPVGKDQLMVTSFGPWPRRCLIMDGLFLAVDLKRVLEVGWRFNENFKFHHYDIASCIDANIKKLKMGTYPINVTHNSPGLSDMNDKEFTSSADKFVELYGR